MQLTIRDVAFGGKGVGSSNGLVVFVPFTIPGEQVTVEITRQKKNYAEADLVSVDVPSPSRVDPQCPYFQHCGGCAYQHIDYPTQLNIKAQQVEQTLKRVGKLANVPMQPIIPSPKPYGYRNRIRVHVAGGVTGFYTYGSNTIVDIDHCPISSPEVNEQLAQFRSRMLPDGDYTVAQRSRPGFFEQVNDGVAAEMLALVERIVTKGGTLVDAYCGAGFFAKRLRHHYSEVIGIEENEFAVSHARQGVEPNERYLAGDVHTHLPSVLSELSPAETTLVLDPPAIGVSPRVIEVILGRQPREIVYVSCDPSTLARDLALLCTVYRLESVTPLDMFPQTAEIETVAHLKRDR